MSRLILTILGQDYQIPQTDSKNLRQTRFGDFDLAPAPGQALIPRNYGMGPGFFSVNLGISRAFAFGNVPAPPAAAAKPAAPGGTQPAPAPSGGIDPRVVQLPKSDTRLRSPSTFRTF